MNIYLCIAILEGQVIVLTIVFLAILLKLSDMEQERKQAIERNAYLVEHLGHYDLSEWTLAVASGDLKSHHEKPESVEHGSPFKK